MIKTRGKIYSIFPNVALGRLGLQNLRDEAGGSGEEAEKFIGSQDTAMKRAEALFRVSEPARRDLLHCSQATINETCVCSFIHCFSLIR